MAAAPVVVLDNGGGTIKAGFAGQPSPVRVFPNATAKAKGERQALVGDMLADTKEVSQLTLRRPFDRGYLVNWDLEREIWGRCLRHVLRWSPADHPAGSGLLMTEPLFNFGELRQAAEQVAFEEYGFDAYFAAPAPLFSLQRCSALQPGLPASAAMSGVVVDAGFSFTHIVPIFNGQVLEAGVKRINMGGKAMTNYLKELVSYRSLNMMEEPYLMDLIKDQLCFVSTDVQADLRAAQNPAKSPHRREFVLPDGVHNLRGYVRDPLERQQQLQDLKAQLKAAQSQEERKRIHQAMEADQVLVLNNERFMVPEVLFHPSDIGLQQAGVPEALVQAVTACHPALTPLLFSNVLLTGGLVQCPGFKERFEAELRPLVPGAYALNVFMPKEPALCAWEGMSAFGASPQYRAVALTKAQYEEGGSLAGVRQYS